MDSNGAWLTSDHNIQFQRQFVGLLARPTQHIFTPTISDSFPSVVINAASFFKTSQCPAQYELLLLSLKLSFGVSWYGENLKVDSNRVSEDRHFEHVTES